MQRIMIVSDTHRRITNLAEALYREGNIDKLIHLGDFEGEDEVIRGMAGCEVMFVPGNNDFFSLRLFFLWWRSPHAHNAP